MAIQNVIKWHKQYPDWKTARKLIHDNYYEEFAEFKLPYPMMGAAINGLNGVMALLYGNGDFTKTIGIATTRGYDCDNQAATIGGLLGVINGANSIPEYFTLDLPSRNSWKVPFNNAYINYARDHLPNYNTISDIVDRLVALAEIALFENGGTKVIENKQVVYHIKTDMN